jgi:diacylglycerol kinase family enzyme
LRRRSRSQIACRASARGRWAGRRRRRRRNDRGDRSGAGRHGRRARRAADGTLNHFAKDLSIPLELEKAVQTLFSGRIARVDVGEVNGRVFLNNSSIGFYPRIMQEREREQRRGRSKWLAFAQAAALIFQQSRKLRVTLEAADGLNQSCDTPFVFVGNNRYAATGLQIGSRVAMDGGKLWVCMAPDAGRFALLALALKAVLGFVRDADMAAFETGQTEVHMRRDHVPVATDGEVS